MILLRGISLLSPDPRLAFMCAKEQEVKDKEILRQGELIAKAIKDSVDSSVGSALDKVAQIVPVNVAAPVASGCPSTSAVPCASSGGPAAATLVPFPPVPLSTVTGVSGTAVSLAPEGMLTKVQLALVAAETGHKVKLESLEIKDVRDALIKHSPHDKYFNGALDACLKRRGVTPPKPRPAKVDALLACVTGIQP